MQELQQGEQYEEDAILEEGEEIEAVTDPGQAAERGLSTLFGIDPKVFIIGSSILVIMLILVVVSVTRKPKGSEQAQIDQDLLAQLAATSTTNTTDTYDIQAQQSPAPVQSTTPAQQSPPIPDGYWLNPDTGIVERLPEVVHTADEVGDDTTKKLRALGYTGDEIEYALKNNISVEALIEEAQKLKDAESAESLHRMSSDYLSPEFQYILDATYIGQPGHEFISYADAQFGSYVSRTEQVTINADYVKCPVYGLQLYLKCKVAPSTYLWYNIAPQRYATLPDSGNIVLSIEYIYYGEYVYVVRISETNSTLDTIDSSNRDNPLIDSTVQQATPDRPMEELIGGEGEEPQSIVEEEEGGEVVESVVVEEFGGQ